MAIENTSPHFEPVDDIGFINVADIDMGDRLRPVDAIHVEVVGRAMLREGQAVPIVVCRLPGRTDWTLVAGAHRVEAARKFGIEQLKAEIIGPDRIGRRQREISENLWRKDLAPIDRANFVAELVRLAKLRAGIDPDADGRSVSANVRWQKQVQDQADDASATIALVYGWADSVAEETGMSRRTVYNDLLLHSRIAPSEMERLRSARHPAANNATQLRALAKRAPEEQTRVIDLLLQTDTDKGPAPKSVSEALSRLSNKIRPAADAETKRLSTFVGTFARMAVAEKKGAIQHLSDLLPAGYNIAGPDAPDLEKIGIGLSAAFDLILRLQDGEAVDDDMIFAAHSKVQDALLNLNGTRPKTANKSHSEGAEA